MLTLVEQLQARGVRAWIDHLELVIGDFLIMRIGDAIREGTQELGAP